jgi:uncharacterized protein
VPPEAFFLNAEDGTGQRFCLYHAPAGDRVRGLVLYVHPFAEEMNKSRRMAALQSRALAQAGYGVLQIDLLGCGDSSGDFADATWEAWIDDVLLGCRWLQQKAHAPLWLWGLRAGCLIAAHAARSAGLRCNFLFWQPVASGKSVLQQFLRLKLAADMAAAGPKVTMNQMRHQLAAGTSAEVAGYALSSGLANDLEAASITPPPPSTTRLVWLELSHHGDTTLLPTSEEAVDSWRAACRSVQTGVVQGPAFWQTAEIEEAPSLLVTSLAVMQDTVSA